MDKIIDISVLFFTCRDCRPDAFAPAQGGTRPWASFFAKLVFDNFVNLFRRKRRTRKFCMTILTAALTLLTPHRNGGFGLDNITRRRLGRIMGILLEPGNFFFELLNAFHKRFNLLSQFSNNGAFIWHPLLITQGTPSRKLPIITFSTFYENFCERLRNLKFEIITLFSSNPSHLFLFFVLCYPLSAISFLPLVPPLPGSLSRAI